MSHQYDDQFTPSAGCTDDASSSPLEVSRHDLLDGEWILYTARMASPGMTFIERSDLAKPVVALLRLALRGHGLDLVTDGRLFDGELYTHFHRVIERGARHD